MLLKIIGMFFVIVGFIISVIFWIPGLIDRQQLRQILGGRYGMVYFIYFTNGPFLLLLGAAILTFFR